MKEFLGVNCYQGTDIRWMKPFYYSRMYTSISRIDVDTVDNWPNIKYYITPNGWWNNGSGDYVMYADSITRDVGNKIWYAYLGVPKWMELKGMWNEDRPVTKIGMNPEDPMSYARTRQYDVDNGRLLRHHQSRHQPHPIDRAAPLSPVAIS